MNPAVLFEPRSQKELQCGSVKYFFFTTAAA